MVPTMSSGMGHVSRRDEECPMEDPEPDIYVVQNNRTALPQLESINTVLDESEPEVASESDGDDDVFFKPSPSLPSPNVIRRTLRELKDLMKTPYLDLDSPEHRPRRYVGSDALTGIIDSLSQNYEFPPIFFNQKQVRGPDGSIQYNRVCIDGLKRLSAVEAFIDGEISCHDYRHRQWFYCVKSENDRESSAVIKRRILPKDDRENFENKYFICHEFEDLTGSEEIELRARVHLGSTLTPGEKLRAAMLFSGGLMISFAKTLESDFQQIADLADTRRMKGFQNLMKCSSQIFEVQRAGAENRAPLLRISETALNDFIKLADASALERINEALKVFGILMTRHPEIFLPTPGVPFRPMEMIIIAVLVFKFYQTKVKPLMFIRLIVSLRESTHNFSRHQGVLQTHQIWTHAWEVIENIENNVIEGGVSDLGQNVNPVTQSEKFTSAMPEEIATLELNEHAGSRASSATFSATHSISGMRVGGTTSSFLQQSTAAKRKASPHPLDLVKKRVQLPTPISPALLQSPRVSLRAGSPDSLLGSGNSEDEHVAESTGGTIQEEPPTQNISPATAPRRLVRSSFRSRSDFVPRRSESPKEHATTLNTLIASVPSSSSPSKAVFSSPSASNVLFGVSQRPVVKPSLLYSHETKKTAPYQSSGTLPSIELPSQYGDRHVTPINQDHLVGYEAPTLPPYSGRGRPRKYPPKSVSSEGQTPRKRGRPRKDSSTAVSDPQRSQAPGIRGHGRGRNSIPRGVSTRATPTSQPDVERYTASPKLQQNGERRANLEQTALVHQSVSPALSPPHNFARLSGRPRNDAITSTIPSVACPPPESQMNHRISQRDVEPLLSDLRSNQGINQVEVKSPPQTITSQPVESEVVEMDHALAPKPGPIDTTTPLSELSGGACHDKPSEEQSAAESADIKQALAPTKPPAHPVSRAQSILQSRPVSISSSREPSISRLSAVGSLSAISPRTTPDPSLLDAKPFVASFKAGGANAIRERRRQQQAELEEKKRRKQEAAKFANSTTDSVIPKD